MRALTVKQPWAEAIAAGVKTVENRRWRTSFVGAVAIHSSLSVDAEAHREEELLAAAGVTAGPTGVVVAVAELAGCHFAGDEKAGCAYRGLRMCSPWAEPGCWHWRLANVRRLTESVTCRGQLGLWTLPPDRQLLVESLLDSPGGTHLHRKETEANL